MRLIVLGLSLIALSGAAASAKQVMPSCKGTTVYAVPVGKMYYQKGAPEYGHAKGGRYMCFSEASAKGYRLAPIVLKSKTKSRAHA